MDIKAVVVVVSSFVLALLIGPIYIKWLKGKQFGQYIREEGPESHLQKQGTPTMGAFIFIIPILTVYGFIFDLTKFENWLYVAIIILFGFIGGVDDYFKVVRKQNEGLTSKQKITLQITFSFLVYLMFFYDRVPSDINIPFINESFDLKFMYLFFVLFLFVGVSNATNLTDGLDGLLAGNAIVSFVSFSVIGFIQGNQQIFLFSLVVAVTLIGFLKVNYNPAKIFMGDTGSLLLGALMVGIAIMLKVEIFLILIGFVYVIETMSVIIQVSSYKLTKKRIFKMSPIHHHFELVGLGEKNIFSLFTLTQIIMATIAVFVFKTII